VTTDGHTAYPRAVREALGEDVQHRTSRYLNNRIEQDHRPIKQRYYPIRGFQTVGSAARFCAAHEEQRQYFRTRRTTGERVSLAEQRTRFQERWAGLLGEVAAA
jgi:transposase-like protein